MFLLYLANGKFGGSHPRDYFRNWRCCFRSAPTFMAKTFANAVPKGPQSLVAVVGSDLTRGLILRCGTCATADDSDWWVK